MIFYVCNPKKNKICSKTNCKENGGECELTSRKEFAKRPIRVKVISKAIKGVQ